MKKKNFSLLTLGVAFVALAGLSSCSRGYGCPYDFSLTQDIYICCKTVLSELFRLI
ncbi:MAG: hypothetical protein IPQ10_11705 [Saprospiraceae bacterium]|nr:hypothetical protein [Saprospiraceae bacterium]MBK7797211.1 hypothetical protein [Saprospiraceae bacterium]MBK8151982.1 hypothetical protein [Saprospiraceae bacterium]MBK9377309.1 hypothetical protein [Saprospiraceae bacterium]MBL0261704.1 hypothetical protein [Saprospiraceae bacterium]